MSLEILWKVTKAVIISSSMILAHVAQHRADVIYLNNGSVLVVERAWADGDQVTYQTSSGIKTIPKSSVERIQKQELTPGSSAPTPKYGIAVETGSGTSATASRPSVSIPLNVTAQDVSDGTIKRLTENAKAEPDNVRAKNELIWALNSYASLLVLRGDLSGAKQSLQQALTYDSKNLTTTINLSILHYQAGEFRAAEDLLLASLQHDSKNQQAHYLLGEVYYAQDKLLQAINEWKTALQLGSDPNTSTRLKKAEEEAGAHHELGGLQSAHFILRYDRKVSDYGLGQEILDSLERNYRQLSSELTPDPPATIAVILYPDQAYFDITRAPRWSGALYDGKIRVPIKGLSAVTADLNSVLIHELTHSFISSLSRGNCPAWFNEGLAQIQEGRSASDQRKFLAQMQSQGHVISLTSLRGSFAGLPAEAAQFAYLEGLSAVQHLVSAHGRRAIRNVLDLLRQNYNFETAFKSATNQSLSEFEKSWKASLTE